MIEEIVLEYEPIVSRRGELTPGMFQLYLEQPSLAKIAQAVVVEPFETAAKESGERELVFGELRLGISQRGRNETRWKDVYQKMRTYLEIRADDSRAEKLKAESLKNISGIGYCISVEELVKQIDSITKECTDSSSWPQVDWPRKKRDEHYPKRIVIPPRNYAALNQETARICLAAKRFCKGIEDEVVKAFKDANKQWFEQETGYDAKDKIPAKDVSPVNRLRVIGRSRYVYMNLVREENPDYRGIVAILRGELSAIAAGDAKLWEEYRTKQDGKLVFVNIKRATERLAELYGGNIGVDTRYEIVP